MQGGLHAEQGWWSSSVKWSGPAMQSLVYTTTLAHVRILLSRDAQYAVRPVCCTLYVVRCTLVGVFCTYPLYVPVRWHWATRLLLLLHH
jgi:hypothetical protein